MGREASKAERGPGTCRPPANQPAAATSSAKGIFGWWVADGHPPPAEFNCEKQPPVHAQLSKSSSRLIVFFPPRPADDAPRARAAAWPRRRRAAY
eukprot:scaffold101940_cov63-Phaeocystis_antarctica.AAC.2